MLDSPDGRWLSFWPLVYADEHPTFCAFVLPRKLVTEAALEDVWGPRWSPTCERPYIETYIDYSISIYILIDILI